jgi:threonine/homoserine/homoserine lactone efflux protein
MDFMCFFLFMGVILILKSNKMVVMNSKLTTPSAFAGFAAGLVVILGNPKAILFYLGVLPGIL